MGRIAGVLAYLLALGGFASAGPARELPAGPDLFYFQDHLATDLHQRCAGCHSDPESAGRFFLQPLDSLTRPDRSIVLKNYRATLAFLDPDAPKRSPLLALFNRTTEMWSVEVCSEIVGRCAFGVRVAVSR